ncbi:MAG: hypothetical protein WKF58_07715 [Ilumatobacteraceae bacterium]
MVASISQPRTSREFDAERQRDHDRNRGERRLAREARQREPGDAERGRDEWVEHEHHPGTGRNAFAAAETVRHGEHVPDDGRRTERARSRTPLDDESGARRDRALRRVEASARRHRRANRAPASRSARRDCPSRLR